MSYDIDSRCKTHLLDPNFLKNQFLLPPEISTTSIFNDEISMKNVHFSWKSGDFEVLLVEISGVLPVEISTNFFSTISAFTGTKNYVHPTNTAHFNAISFIVTLFFFQNFQNFIGIFDSCLHCPTRIGQIQ